MKQVGVREFRDHATLYLSGSDQIAVTKNGHVIGIYTPIKRDDEKRKRDYEKRKRALDQLGETVNRILEETGMTEDELADIFDVSKPLPE